MGLFAIAAGFIENAAINIGDNVILRVMVKSRGKERSVRIGRGGDRRSPEYE